MNHDQITNSILEKYEDADIETEKHYNHYGSRGVADAVAEWTSSVTPRRKSTVEVLEIKSHIESANKVIRQFNKMSEFFFSSYEPNHTIEKAKFKLMVHFNEENLRKIWENKNLFDGMISMWDEEGYDKRLEFVGEKIPDSETLYFSQIKAYNRLNENGEDTSFKENQFESAWPIIVDVVFERGDSK